MTHLEIQDIEKKLSRKVPVLRPGYRVRVHQKIKEGDKERIQIFEGIVICFNSGHGISKTVTVRKEVEGIGVEKIFPLSSPNVAKIDIVKTFGVRRAKLYYLRDKEGLSTRLRAKLGLVEKDALHRKEAHVEEAVEEKAEKKEAPPQGGAAATEAAPAEKSE